VKQGTIGQASLVINATPAALYDTVSDVRRIAEWSPECRRCVWLDGATGPVVGARFKGSNRRGLVRWSTKPRVVVAEPGKEFAFVTTHLGRDATRWSYRFEPSSGGTDVTESFEMLFDMPWYFSFAERWFMGVKDRKTDLESSMRETLGRLKTAVENPVDTTT
jgi:hypothetical protein